MATSAEERYARLAREGGARLEDPQGLARAIAADEGAQVRLAMFRALADPTRFVVVELLRRAGPLATTELEVATGVASGTLSHHLRVLETARLVVPERAGGWTFWRVVAYPLVEVVVPPPPEGRKA
ncbi:MAG TPA: metalloregulator ArsR/SmtB family transcription factor [Candidatus Thermoplasmatota archaeon]|nr:metalloregulator ArsR/SmtB family transcription factor [Candidatus Thermoplasmatota archaeon]